MCGNVDTFVEVFGGQPKLGAVDFFHSELEFTEMEDFDLLRRKGYNQALDESSRDRRLKTLTRHQQQRLVEQLEQAEKDIAEAKSLDSDVRVFNLMQNKSHATRMVCGEIQKDPLCTFTGHGLLWNTDRERPLLTLEWLMVHGIPACPGLCGHKRPLVDFHKLLTDAQVLPGEVQSMVGNGWHLPSMGQWIMS